jgi:membrane-bound lytic murein transglycosylase B
MFRLHTALAALLVASSAAAESDPRQAFIDQMVSEHGFEAAEIARVLEQAQLRQDIIDAISRPAEAKPWWQYQRIFLTQARAEGGVAYWEKNAELLAQAEQTYGVAPEIIVAIIGVETFYGRHTGSYRVIDALSTLGFHYPPRAKFFRGQLGEFLLLAREEQMDPAEPLGSYAGALGRPQFIPSSYRHYAVDFDGDGKRDIWGNDADVIGSVANYFARHGWQPGGQVVFETQLRDGQAADLVQRDSKTRYRLGELRQAGVTAADGLADDTPASLFALEEEQGGNSHWVGLDNFYVITRYNHSNLYAMAVYQLSRRILELRQETLASAAGD